MPGPLCAVCDRFDLAFDLLRFWEPLVFFGIPTELTVKEQSRFFVGYGVVFSLLNHFWLIPT